MTKEFIAIAFSFTLACGAAEQKWEPSELVDDPISFTHCFKEPPAVGKTIAKRITCAEELFVGPMASGRLGDFLLENARIKVIIRGPGEGFYLPATKGGGLVDAARHGHPDLIKEIIPVLELDTAAFTEFSITESGDDGPATLVVRGMATAVPLIRAAVETPTVSAIVEQHYILEADAVELKIVTYLFNQSDNPAAVGQTVTMGDLLFYGGRVKSWLPGFGPAAGNQNTFIIASHGEDSSYGIVYPKTNKAPLKFLSVANINIAWGPWHTIGTTHLTERYFLIGDGSTSSITDRGWSLREEILGTIQGATIPRTEILVVDQADAPITRIHSDENGAFSALLPPGDYRIKVDDPRMTPLEYQAIKISAEQTTTIDLEVGDSGAISVSVIDTRDIPIPARVIITTVSKTYTEYSDSTGVMNLQVPTGNYTITVSRGMEYTAVITSDIMVNKDEESQVSVTLERVLATPGWISVDTHLHSEMSTDSQIPLATRILAVAGEGVEVAISTDHDFITDYASLIEPLGLDGWVRSIIGSEVSNLLWHINAWPLVPDTDRAAAGAIVWYGNDPASVFKEIRERGDTVIQVNHPRTGSGLFSTIDFDPETVTARRDPEDLGYPANTVLDDFNFDAIEIANGFNAVEFQEGFVDWVALLKSGKRVAATGCSDSHGITDFAGSSRTYVYVGENNDYPLLLDEAAFNRAFRKQKVVVAQGAFVTAQLIDPLTMEPIPFGEVAPLDTATTADLKISVQAPPWMPLGKITIYRGSTIVKTVDLDASMKESLRFDQIVNLPLGDSDGFYVVLVTAAGPGTPVLGMPSGSFTNAILYDRDGDGEWMGNPSN